VKSIFDHSWKSGGKDQAKERPGNGTEPLFCLPVYAHIILCILCLSFDLNFLLLPCPAYLKIFVFVLSRICCSVFLLLPCPAYLKIFVFVLSCIYCSVSHTLFMTFSFSYYVFHTWFSPRFMVSICFFVF